MIDFNSDKIILISFISGSAGHMLCRLISFSEEVCDTEQQTNTYDFRKPVSGDDYITCHLHNWFTVDNKHLENSDNIELEFGAKKARQYIKDNATESFKTTLAENEKRIPLITHFVQEAADVFPNAKTVHIDLTEVKSRYFTIRANSVKNIKYFNPAAYYCEDYLKKREQYYRYYISRWFEPNKIKNTIIPDEFHKVSLIKILEKDRTVYEQLCAYLEITPSNEFEEFIDAYNEGQWTRDDL